MMCRQSSAVSPDLLALAALKRQFFEYDFAQKSLERIGAFHQISWASRSADFMLFFGETGTGKSTLVKQYCRSFLTDAEYAEDELPILYISIPSPCSPKSLAEVILAKLGDPSFSKGTLSNMYQRILCYTKSMKVSLIVLDEFQHFIDKKSYEVFYQATDWLKSLANDIECPFLAVGLPSTVTIIKRNEQLERRVVSNIELTALPYRSAKDVDRFQMLLALFGQSLTFDNPEFWVENETAKKIHVASRGVIGRVARLIRLSGERAIAAKSKVIKTSHLSAAIDELDKLSSEKKCSALKFKERVFPVKSSKKLL